MWVVLLIIILIVLSVMFGGFQKGTKSSGLLFIGGVSQSRVDGLGLQS
jgi:hypothetical protein